MRVSKDRGRPHPSRRGLRPLLRMWRALLIARGVGGARGALRPFLSPGQVRGDGAPRGATSWCPALRRERALCEARCASRRPIAAFSLRRRAPLSHANRFNRPSRSASSWQGTLISPGGAPATPQCGFCVEPVRRSRIPLRRLSAPRRRPRMSGKPEGDGAPEKDPSFDLTPNIPIGTAPYILVLPSGQVRVGVGGLRQDGEGDQVCHRK